MPLRFRPARPARALRHSAAAALLLALPGAARAQLDRAGAGVQNGGESYVNPAEGFSFSPCAPPDGGTPAAFDVACTFGSRGRIIGTGGVGTMRMAASATAGGTLHAYARTHIVDGVQSVAASVVRSYASYWDGIVFSGYVPAYLRVTAVLHGRALAAENPCEQPLCSRNGPPDEPPSGAVQGELEVLGGDWTQRILAGPDSPEQQTATFDFPVSLYWSESEQTEYFNFGVTLTAFAWAIPGTFAQADFGNTAWVSSIRAVSDAGCDLAAAGCDVTALVQQGGVRAASGASYGGFTTAAVTTAPEPATVALLGAGVLALAGVGARRRVVGA
jgi:hypothetical protein